MALFNVLDGSGTQVLVGSFWVPTIVKGKFTPQASYAAGATIGGLLTVNLVQVNTKFSLQLASLAILGFNAGPGIEVFAFEANPTSSTFTDGTPAVVGTADLPSMAWHGTLPAQNNYFGTTLPATFDGYPRRMATTDPTGNIYVAFVASGITTILNPAAEWRVEARN